MKATYVKSAVRSFTKQMKAQCADEDEELPHWATPEWSLGVKAPVGCGCPLDPAIGTPAANLTGYRNKCEFTIGRTEAGEVECGFVVKQSKDGGQVIEASDASPHTPDSMKILC